MGSCANVILFYLCCVLYIDKAVQASDGSRLVQLTDCSASFDGKLINLESVQDSLSVQLGDWNYTFSPCFKFSAPENANHGFGDKCLAVALCKSGEQNRRKYYYTLGFHNGAEFVSESQDNATTISLQYTGFRSMKGKRTYVRLVCDTERTQPGDALFTVVKDMKGLGNVYAELHHVSCCLDGFRLVKQTPLLPTGLQSAGNQSKTEGQTSKNFTSDNTDVDVFPGNKADRVGPDRVKVMIIVGVNVGVILMAGVIGLLCYSRKSHTEFYSKLPGVRTVPDPSLWQLANLLDPESQNAGPIISTAQAKPAIPSSAKSAYRDGAPQRRKSISFPVLEHCGIPEDCLSLGQRLGGSMFGDTYKGEWSGITVSVKRLTISVHKYQINKEYIGELKRHVAFLSKQRHRNIVSMLGYCEESTYPYIISEYITGQVMKDFVKNAGQQLAWPHRVKILSQIADGMAFLHSTQPPILHRDLRCGNMFITNTDVVKICDFAVVNIIQPVRSGCQLEDCCCQGLYSACPPSIAWTAPEVLEHPNSHESEGHITTASDVYSYAIVMWELVVGDDPYEDMNTAQEVMDYVLSGGRPEITADTKMLKPYSMLMNKCWDGSPNERPNFKQITVQLKEILHQAKMFQKALSNKGSRTSKNSLRVSFSDNNEKT